MGGGAWPFLVGGVNCLVDSVNERDLELLNSSWKILHQGHRSVFSEGSVPREIVVSVVAFFPESFLEGLLVISQWKFEAKTGL